jgi:hypothetical protein
MLNLPMQPTKTLKGLLFKMHNSFKEWQAKRDGKALNPSHGSPPSRREPVLASSRVSTSRGKGEITTDGVYSYNQMVRLEKGKSYRPPSEVGTVRSVRSVMTVEEQVDDLSRQVVETKESVKRLEEQTEKTQALLQEILTSLKTGQVPLEKEKRGKQT